MSIAIQPQAIRQKPDSSVMLSLLLVFLAGVAVGALAMSLGIHNPLHSRAFSASEINRPTLERWKKELDLTPQQTAQMESLLDDFTLYYDNVLADGYSRIMQILNARQREKFKQLMKQR